MTAQSIQLRKEARQLLWPWFAVTLGGLASLFYFSQGPSLWSPLDSLALLFPLGFFLGVPLLAALPLGTEFQNGTLSLLLAQPVDRHKLWLQKWIVTLAAVLPPAILYLLAGYGNREFGPDLWMAASWMFAATAGAMAWTLIAKSTLGGLALGSGSYWIFYIAWSFLWDHLGSEGNSVVFRWVTVILLLAYCATMIFVGRRMFLRFQAVEGMLGNEALTLVPGVRFLTQLSMGWLRPRPRGAILDLFRREIRLLRIVWLLSPFSLAAWTCLAAFSVSKLDDSWITAPAIFLAGLLSFLMALLAGALPLGEEKTWGTHGWHLTLPLSASTQWLVKLFVALSVSIVCAVGIPFSVLLARGWLAGALPSHLGHLPVWLWVCAALSITLLAFWCSCVVKGTVRAVLAVFPMLFALGLTISLSNWLAYRAMLHSDGFLDLLLSKCDLFRLNRMLAVVANPKDDLHSVLAAIVAPILTVGLIQSLRMFRLHLEDRKPHAVRNALALVVIFLFSTFALSWFLDLAIRLQFRQQDVIREAHLAIESLQTSASGSWTTAVQKFTVTDLDKASHLSDHTRYWLRNSTILVRPEEAHAGLPARIQWPYEYAFIAPGARGKPAVPYTATILTAKGSECNLRFWASGTDPSGFLTEACQ